MTYPITELYAWIVDDPTGQHGIIAGTHDGLMVMQAVSSKREAITRARIRNIVDVAREATGKPVMLQRFVLAETMETLNP